MKINYVHLWGACILLLPRPVHTQCDLGIKFDSALEFWKSFAPVCEEDEAAGAGGFPAKENCDDADATLLGGLLCAAGAERGCDAVRRAQGPDGRWWRSPARVGGGANSRGEESEGGSSSFSRGMSIGVMLYLVSTRDAAAAANWTRWIEENRPCSTEKPNGDCLIRGEYRLCTDDKGQNDVDGECDIRPNFWGLMEKVYIYLGLIPTNEMEGMGGIYDATIDLEAANVELGYDFHLYAAQTLLLRSMGTSPNTADALADRLARHQWLNPFFKYLRDGRSKEVVDMVIDFCPSPETDPNSFQRHQWAWELDQTEEAWRNSMGWDCIFMAYLLKGAYPQLRGQTARHVAVGSTNEDVWIVDDATVDASNEYGGILRRNTGGNTWNDLHKEIRAARIAVAPDGTVWVVNGLGVTYHMSNSGEIFYLGATVHRAGTVRDVAVGANGAVWIVETFGTSDANEGMIRRYTEDNTWDDVHSDVRAARIAVAPDGTVWMVTGVGDVYSMDDAGVLLKRGSAARDVAVGPAGDVWIVDDDSVDTSDENGGLIRRNTGGNNWDYVRTDVRAESIAIAPDGRVWVVDGQGQVFSVYIKIDMDGGACPLPRTVEAGGCIYPYTRSAEGVTIETYRASCGGDVVGDLSFDITGWEQACGDEVVSVVLVEGSQTAPLTVDVGWHIQPLSPETCPQPDGLLCVYHKCATVGFEEEIVFFGEPVTEVSFSSSSGSDPLNKRMSISAAALIGYLIWEFYA